MNDPGGVGGPLRAAPSVPGLDEQLCFALYTATNSVVREYRPLLDELGLTYPQYLIMLALWHEGDKSVGELATRLRLAPHAISPMLDRMEANGLLVRIRDDIDRRLVHVVLTDEGHRLEPAVAEVQRDVACRTTLSRDEEAAIRTALQSLVDRMDEAGAS